MYSHLTYDIVPDVKHYVRQPDILILRAQRPADRADADGVGPLRLLAYVDAKTSDIERWYVSRFLQMRTHVVRGSELALPLLRRPQRHAGNCGRPRDLDVDQPAQPGGQHPARASARPPVLRKDSDHSINRVRLRKL